MAGACAPALELNEPALRVVRILRAKWMVLAPARHGNGDREHLEHLGDVGRAMAGVANPGGVGGLLGRLGVSALDQHVVLALATGERRHAAIGTEDAKLGVFAADRRGTVSSTLDPDARPRRQLVGDLIDERRDARHRAFAHRLRGDAALATRLNRLLVMPGPTRREQR
jgi:hypothetical protein